VRSAFFPFSKFLASEYIEVFMENLGKQLFNLQRFLLLQAKLNPQTSEFISDSEAFAWSIGLYPFRSESKISKDLEPYFDIPKEKVIFIVKYIDAEWIKKTYHTFYDLELYFQSVSSGNFIIDRFDLIYTLRYCYLENMFDDHLWEELLARGNGPIEADCINKPFSNDGDIDLLSRI
jgi:hypothetical protein